MKHLILYTLLFFLPLLSSAQKEQIYNLNINNGLSTNHIYCTLVDKVGYLWIGTDDGVYRYNGYTLKKYSFNKGLSSKGIWSLYEDREGRIWLLSIAQNIGYIYNNKYTQVVKHKNVSSKQLYPAFLKEIARDTICFYNKSTFNHLSQTFGIIYNDTLYEKKLGNSSNPNHISLSKLFYEYRFVRDNIVAIGLDSIKIYDRSSLYDYKSTSPGKLLSYYMPDVQVNIEQGRSNMTNQFAEKYLTYSNREDGVINIFNVLTNEKTIFDLQGQKLSQYIISQDSLYILTNKGTFIVDSNLNEIAYYDHPSPIIKDGMNIVYFLENSFWGKLSSTTNRGLFIQYQNKDTFHRIHTLDNDYTFLNNKNDSTGYWWNEETNILTEVTNGEIIRQTKVPDTINSLKKVSSVDAGTIIHSQNYLSWLEPSFRSLIKNYSQVYFLTYPDRKVYDINKESNGGFHGNLRSVYDLHQIKSNEYLLLATGIVGAVILEIPDTGGTFYMTKITNDRYEKVIEHNYSGQLICYSSDKLMLLKGDKCSAIYQDELDALLGIRDIENIATDKYEHIFIKSAGDLTLINPRTFSFRRVLKNYNLTNSYIHVKDDILIVAGTFGISKYKVLPDGGLINLLTIPNTKNINYSRVISAQISYNIVLLKTDKGYFTVNTTVGDSKEISTEDKYKFIADVDDSLSILTSNDTLSVAQNFSRITLDLIHPTGTGSLNISYSVNGKAYRTGNQIDPVEFKAGSYNTVSIIASDETWKSAPLRTTIYVQPYWWQKKSAILVFFILAALFLVALIYIVIFLTRKIVNRNNERRNQQRELELKSIYSQINPHFIFNTLSTAQYFVRKNRTKEAYDHINQFSDLLRSYIKSSRNKYITINEEIENLYNYLELQLSRFENKFTYNIDVSDSINPDELKIPSLLLQPIVENALNHGIFHKSGPGHLLITFEWNDNKELVCTVDDNGVGRKRAKELKNVHIKKASSYGTILIKELIDTFNKYEKVNIAIQYIDKEAPDTGTTVVIRIKDKSNM